MNERSGGEQDGAKKTERCRLKYNLAFKRLCVEKLQRFVLFLFSFSLKLIVILRYIYIQVSGCFYN
jgi:hypothetical protein